MSDSRSQSGRVKCRTLLVALVLALVTADGSVAGQWQPLEEDGLHDPSGAAVELLQQPEEALGVLPEDTAGNKVDWVRAIESGRINPRASLSGEDQPEILDLDIVMRETSTLDWVLFAHQPHTQWLDCKNCHETPFLSETGANPINMLKILEGQYCGTCHGAVAFPLTECNRCHSVKPGSVVSEDDAAAEDKDAE